MFNTHILLEVIFAVIILAFLVIDLGYLNRKPHKVSMKEAVIQSIFWILISVAYGLCIYKILGSEPAVQFFSAYVTEKMLSVDNLFVILLVFNFFKLEERYYHRVLFWGIFGAVVLRGLFIGFGSVAISHFHWILYIFGAVLLYTGIKLFFKKEDDEEDFENNKVFKLARKYLRFTDEHHDGKFMTRVNGKKYFTTLFLILLLVETTDIIFALDSIPAVFSISQDPFIVFTSNIFAVMGLRALFFLVENILKRFHLLQKGLSFVLVFIGGKMIMDMFGVHIPSTISFYVIIGTLVLSWILSVIFPKHEDQLPPTKKV